MEADWLHWFAVIMSTSRGVVNVNLSIDPQNSSAVLGRSKREGKIKDGGMNRDFWPSVVCAGLCHCLRGTNSVIVYILVTPSLQPIKTRSRLKVRPHMHRNTFSINTVAISAEYNLKTILKTIYCKNFVF